MSERSPSSPTQPARRRSSGSELSAYEPRYRLNRRGKVVFTVLPLLLVGVVWLTVSGGGNLAIAGLDHDAVLGPDAVSSAIVVATDQEPGNVKATIDGNPVDLVPGTEGELELTLDGLEDGEHLLEVTAERAFPFRTLVAARAFTLDTTPPLVEVLSPTGPVPIGESVMVRAQVDDTEADIAIDGEAVAPNEEGIVERSFPEVPDQTVIIIATDALGNEARQSVPIELALPGAPGAPPMIGVHASGWTWTTDVLKGPIMEMIDDGLINTVEIDLKDEGGDIWYDTSVELAHEIGAVTVLWDVKEVVDELHAKGVRVVGRIVNFRDPRMADYAVNSGNMDWVIQNPDGSAYGQYGGFTNPFNDEVREYNIAIAEEAAELGIDDILYDYVRRPDTLSELVYPGQQGTPTDAIVEFLAESAPRVRAHGARLGASVFGIAATRPDEVAQDIPRMAREVDYVAPMVYPSHWGPGEYGVANPNAEPYDITQRSLAEFVTLTEGTGAHVVAWLQDFSLGVEYGATEVRAQIQAARDAGVENFLLWDAATTYTRGGLDPIK